MKLNELKAEEHRVTAKSMRAQMRAHAMTYRQSIAPDSAKPLSERGSEGAQALGWAISYRGYAQSWNEMADTYAHR